jgi:hypothetical protein
MSTTDRTTGIRQHIANGTTVADSTVPSGIAAEESAYVALEVSDRA